MINHERQGVAFELVVKAPVTMPVPYSRGPEFDSWLWLLDPSYCCRLWEAAAEIQAVGFLPGLSSWLLALVLAQSKQLQGPDE